MHNGVRARIGAILATLGCVVAAVSPATAADPRPNFVSVKVSTLDAAGVADDAPGGIRATAFNLTSGQSFDLTAFPGVLIADALPDGVYRLRIAADGVDGNWAPVWWPGVYSEAAAGSFSLDSSATGCSPSAIGPVGCYGLAFTTVLPQARSLTGTVTNRGGMRLPAVPVTARLSSQPATVFSGSSDASGQFFFAVPPGVYEVSAPNGNRRASQTVELQGSAASATLIMLDVPEAPTDVQATSHNSSATIAWAPPGDAGGTPITGYTAVARPGGLSCTATGRSCSIAGLTNNQEYSVSVVATNAVGTSTSSAPATVSPRELAPGSPTSVRARAQSRAAEVSWTPPADASAVHAYRVTSTPGNLECTTSTVSCSVVGLVNGTHYRFQVVAINGGGQSPPSAASNRVTPADLPSAPRNVRVRAGSASVLVRWLGPATTGGAPVTAYTATSFPSGRTCTTDGSVRGCAIGGLTNGTAYSIVVTASNRIGTSERSAGSASVAPRASLPPLASDISVSPASGRVTRAVTLRWSATSPARQVRVNWQRSPSAPIVTKSGAATGSVRVPVKSGTRVRVWVQALDAKQRPVGEVRRSYRR